MHWVLVCMCNFLTTFLQRRVDDVVHSTYYYYIWPTHLWLSVWYEWFERHDWIRNNFQLKGYKPMNISNRQNLWWRNLQQNQHFFCKHWAPGDRLVQLWCSEERCLEEKKKKKKLFDEIFYLQKKPVHFIAMADVLLKVGQTFKYLNTRW